ncbi:hypothetical protein Celaphus_00009511 [Cervus elaphus hippelaphus]|uniref:Uncharacterized protein n=1 Tax=Cervus elaphus hippelaphus TaxID=46360 RepID=A0A212C0V6_CEREH|nr:hypothetical protein Celaphus_00009511 [Cervus elaphus hippelaphus]
MQQRNFEVKTKKNKLRTPLELEMVAAPRRSRVYSTVENKDRVMSRIGVKVTIPEQLKRWLAPKQDPKPKFQVDVAIEDKQVPYFIHYSVGLDSRKQSPQASGYQFAETKRTSKSQSTGACRGEDAGEGRPLARSLVQCSRETLNTMLGTQQLYKFERPHTLRSLWTTLVHPCPRCTGPHIS